jgi:hypothetical protein
MRFRSGSGTFLNGRQRLFQIGNQVITMFNSNG